MRQVQKSGSVGRDIRSSRRPGRRSLDFNEALHEATLHSRAFGSAMYGRSSRKSSCRSHPVICVPSSSPHAASD
jgi:hypothetical protein